MTNVLSACMACMLSTCRRMHWLSMGDLVATEFSWCCEISIKVMWYRYRQEPGVAISFRDPGGCNYFGDYSEMQTNQWLAILQCPNRGDIFSVQSSLFSHVIGHVTSLGAYYVLQCLLPRECNAHALCCALYSRHSHLQFVLASTVLETWDKWDSKPLELSFACARCGFSVSPCTDKNRVRQSCLYHILLVYEPRFSPYKDLISFCSVQGEFVWVTVTPYQL